LEKNDLHNLIKFIRESKLNSQTKEINDKNLFYLPKYKDYLNQYIKGIIYKDIITIPIKFLKPLNFKIVKRQ